MSFLLKLFRRKKPKPDERDDASLEGRDDASLEGRDDASLEGSKEEEQ